MNGLSEQYPLLTVDAKGRVIAAVGKEGSHKLEVRASRTRGVLDRSFGEEGVIRVGFGTGAGNEVDSAGVDSRGRIVGCRVGAEEGHRDRGSASP